MSDADPSLEEKLGEMLRLRGCTVATAESCSGGLIADRITDVPGSSDYFCGGLVVYSNKAKMAMLGVSKETLERHGAVSEAVAKEMSEKARELFDADIAVGVTGIAGPGGGTDEKPVGLVYIAVSSEVGTVAKKQQFGGGRTEVKAQTAEEALNLIVEHL